MLRVDRGKESLAYSSGLKPGQVLTLSVVSRVSAVEAWLGVGKERLLAVSEKPIPDRGRYRVDKSGDQILLKLLDTPREGAPTHSSLAGPGVPSPARDMAGQILGRLLLKKNEDNLSYLEKLLEFESTLLTGSPLDLSRAAKRTLVLVLPFLKAGIRLPRSELDRLLADGSKSTSQDPSTRDAWASSEQRERTAQASLKNPHALAGTSENFKGLNLRKLVMDDGLFQSAKNTEVSQTGSWLQLLRADSLIHHELFIHDRPARLFAGRLPEKETEFYKLFYDSARYGEIRILILRKSAQNDVQVGYQDPGFAAEIPALGGFLETLLKEATGSAPSLSFALDEPENIFTYGNDRVFDEWMA